MSNDHTSVDNPQKHLEFITQEILSSVERPAKLLSILLQGSVARGVADSYSDIELMCIWSDKTTDDDRASTFAGIEKQELFPEELEGGEWFYSFMYKGVKVDACHVEIELMRQTVSDVMNVRTTSIAGQTLLASIHDAKPLFGQDVFSELVNSFAAYPEQLAIKCIKVNASFQEWSMRNALSERQDLIALHHLIDMTTLQMLRLLYAANKIYLRSYNFKWMASQLGTIPHKPEKLEQRLRQILSASGDPLVELDNLLHETFTVVSELYPDFDLTEAMKTLKFVRQKI